MKILFNFLNKIFIFFFNLNETKSLMFILIAEIWCNPKKGLFFFFFLNPGWTSGTNEKSWREENNIETRSVFIFLLNWLSLCIVGFGILPSTFQIL